MQKIRELCVIIGIVLVIIAGLREMLSMLNFIHLSDSSTIKCYLLGISQLLVALFIEKKK